MTKEFPNIKVLGPDYNLDDPNKATQQTAAVLAREPDLAGVFGTNVFSAQGAGAAVVNAGLGGKVQVVAYDATKQAIELMDKGEVSLVLAQKPFDMGYMAVQFAAADAAGVTSLPQPRRDRLRHHRQGQREGPGDRSLHLPDARQVASACALLAAQSLEAASRRRAGRACLRRCPGLTRPRISGSVSDPAISKDRGTCS